jgi:two-component system CheB/CheR fusion protein
MYFNAETQARILSRFHFALNDTGFLFLGKAEMLFTHASLFTPVDLKRRVFTKVPRVSLKDRLLVMSSSNGDEDINALSEQVRYRESAFDANPVAQFVIDKNSQLIVVNERARQLLNLTPKDLNRPLDELEVSFRLPELRGRIEEAFNERRPTMLKEVDWGTSSADFRTFEIQVFPLLDTDGQILGASISFTDISRYRRLQEEIEHSNQELETAYEELQSTNEELETTNEELQSTIEELETTNEELQSTNEELETINEELQSANEELQTINEELRRRTEELNQVNSFMESILRSLRGGVVVMDRELRVQVWNSKAEDLWGLRSNEVRDKNFLNLDIGLPVEQLRNGIRASLMRQSEYVEEVDAINRRGKSIRCRVTCTPLLGVTDHGVNGVIVLMEEIDPT